MGDGPGREVLALLAAAVAASGGEVLLAFGVGGHRIASQNNPAAMPSQKPTMRHDRPDP